MMMNAAKSHQNVLYTNRFGRQRPLITSIMLLLLVLLVCLASCYPTCSKIDLSGYTFDLRTLQNQNTPTTFKINGNSFPAQISFCSANLICDNDSASPFYANYSLISATSPRMGIKISYLPYKKNQNQNQKVRYTYLNVLCKNTNLQRANCSYTDQGNSQTLVCNFPSEAGCPSLKNNYFWQFLNDNSIVFAILLWLTAIFELLFGYMAIRLTIFIFGTMTGSIFGIVYTAENYVDFIYQDESYGIAVYVICLSVFMGILLGISLLTIPKLGYINIGLWVAVILALLLQNGVLYLTGSLLAFYITVGVAGLLMTVIALMAFKNFIILSTSFISAFWIVRPLGFFLPSYPNEFLYGESYLLTQKTEWQFYLYVISIIILTILGSVFQFFCSRKSSRQGNEGYYLEEEGTFKEKLKNLLEFQQVRDLVKNGTDELKFFKNLIVDSDEEDSGQEGSRNRAKRQLSEQQAYQPVSNANQTRKATKLEKQMAQYKSKTKQKTSLIQMQPMKPQKLGKSENTANSKKNRKVIVEQISISDSSEQQSEEDFVEPNKLTVPTGNKGRKR